MAQHAKLPMYRRVHPIWAFAAVVVGAVTVGTYSLWSPSDSLSASSEEEDDATSSPVGDNWHAPLYLPPPPKPEPPAKHEAPPPAGKHEAPPPKSRPKSKPPARAKSVAKKKVVQSTRAARLVSFALAQVGKPYVFGGNGPNVFDCSGLTKADYAHVGVYLPRTSQGQSLVGTRVSLSSLKPGDLLFWGPAGESHHVAIYIGHGEYVAAENPGVGIVVRSLSFFAPDFARRVL